MAEPLTEIEQALGVVRISLPTPFPVGPVSVYLMREAPPVLVDTGLKTEESYEALRAALAAHGYAVGDLGAIIITHGHRDHMGVLGRLIEESGAATYAHPLVAKQGRADERDGELRKQFYIDILREFGVPEAITDQANSLYDRFRAMSEPFAIDYVVEDGGRAREFEVHFVPGHSPSDTLFVDRERGFSFIGDHILKTTNPNPLLRRPEAGEARAKALVEYRASLRKSRELDLGVCLPGHGEPFTDHVSVIDGILAKQDKRSEQVLKLLRQGARTPYAISKAMFPELPLPNLHLGPVHCDRAFGSAGNGRIGVERT